MNFKKMKVIVNWQSSINFKKIQKLISFCNFYWHFIKEFFKIVRLMLKFIQKNTIFQWFETCQKIFEQLKDAIIFASVFRHFDRFWKFILEIDSFDYVNGKVLFQYDDEDVLHSMTFYNKNIILTKCNYEIYDKKLLIIIKCLEHWRSKLKATNILIKIFIDHKSLKHFMIIKELSRRQTRWILFLFKFNFKIMYQTKSRNIKTNSLTRLLKFTFKNEIDV